MTENRDNDMLGDIALGAGIEPNDSPNHRSPIIHTNYDKWTKFLELQDRQMMEFIKTIQDPKRPLGLALPEFNPDNKDADAGTWCNIQ